jgi:formiminoglutamase
MMTTAWLTVRQGNAPLVLSMPHAGHRIPGDVAGGFVSAWLAVKDTDWWIDQLYDFADEIDATVVRTAISRSAIDVNRDPSGASLYPGQATTSLCPTTSFDGEALYREGHEPDAAEIERRKALYLIPYHSALANELTRLRSTHKAVVLYDCHSIRSAVPRLFEGLLPIFNIGTNSGASAAPALCADIERICAASGYSWIANGRFKGGYITRRFGEPGKGVHAVQMELACRGYLRETPGPVDATGWPITYDSAYAETIRTHLRKILQNCIAFVASQ